MTKAMSNLLREHGFLIIFLASVFLLTIQPILDFDVWFHVKSGEVFSEKGILFHDIFSHSAQGREWLPYEWLFQITIYQFQRIFGFESIKIFTSIITATLFLFLYLILRKIFKLNNILCIIISFFCFSSVYEFITPRPHLLAYTFFVINLFFILRYYFAAYALSFRKDLLWITFLPTLLWTNLHGSIFLDVIFFMAFCLISLLNYLLFKNELWLKKFKRLLIYTLCTFILTILPPLGFTQYQLLIRFFEYRNLVTKYIEEWVPLFYNPLGFAFFTLSVILILLSFGLVVWKKKLLSEIFWVIPFLILIVATYTASRNIFLGYIALSIILGFTLKGIFEILKSNLFKESVGVIILVTIISSFWMLYEKKKPQHLFFYPEEAVEFIKNYKLEGNMFNEYGYGGYLLFNLYPEQKVFIDGRTDIYLCCEMPETMRLADQKNLTDEEYKKILDKFLNKYDFSFVVISVSKHSILRKIARILTDDPNWSLVFWDDKSQIFVKRDNKNNKIIERFAASSATPYNRNPFRNGQEDQAMVEYRNIIQITDSARSRNAIGFILLRKYQPEEAKKEFEKAVQLDPNFESPYMNLAEISLATGNIDDAIILYDKAQKLAPDRGLIYIRLGQLYFERTGDKKHTREIYENGIRETVDEDAKNTLKKLIEENR